MSVRAITLLVVLATGYTGSVLLTGSSSNAALPKAEVATALASPLNLLVEAVSEHKLVLLGEMHGTTETPALVGDLVGHESAAGRKVILALEITSLDQSLVDRYLASDGKFIDRAALLVGEHWQEPTHDGRDSVAMLELIERVRALRHGGADISVDLFDVPGKGDRDTRMANHLRSVVQRSPKATVLVLTGNVHAMTARPTGQMFNNGKEIEPPMTAGRYLVDLHPLSIKIAAAAGDAWVCLQNGCRSHALPNQDMRGKPAMEVAKSSASAWNATLTLPKFTASPPAVPTIAN